MSSGAVIGSVHLFVCLLTRVGAEVPSELSEPWLEGSICEIRPEPEAEAV